MRFGGCSYSDDEIERAIQNDKKRLQFEGCVVSTVGNDADLIAEAAEAVSKGLVVGWFQGRMEWGPRALGNRSILGDPRRSDMKEILNLKIKRRESFRPFAPSVISEEVGNWFEQDDPVPFMMQVYQVKSEKRAGNSRSHPCRWIWAPTNSVAAY